MLSKHSKSYRKRTKEQLRHHYEVEKKIADRLRQSSREERTQIMRDMYEELFAQVPDHPRLTSRKDSKYDQIAVARQIKLIERYIRLSHTLLEFGPGNCSLSLALCSRVAHVYAVDISKQKNPFAQKPEHFNFIVYDGYNLDMPKNSIDVVYSHQVIEHLHPDDTPDHFRLVYQLLKPGGIYVICTCQKLYGPCDVSRYFSDVPQGFHLKEWTFKELSELVMRLGFSRWDGCWFAKGICFRIPRWLILVLEQLISFFPVKIRRWFGRCLLPCITMIAQK